MADITLYTQEKVGAGLATVHVCRVKNAGGVRVVSEVAACEYPVDPAMSPTLVNYGRFSPVSGKADLILKFAEQDIDLAKCKRAVALGFPGREKQRSTGSAAAYVPLLSRPQTKQRPARKSKSDVVLTDTISRP
jgi:hypothetical protein